MKIPDSSRLRRIALRTALIYMAAAGVWIFASDKVVHWMVPDTELMSRLSIVKGWFFVFVTGALLFLGLRRQLRRIEDQVEARHRASEALAEHRRRLDSIIEGTGVATWEWHVPSGGVVYNDRWAEMLGYSLAELHPISIETWYRFLHPDDRARIDDVLQRHFSGELAHYDCECRMRHKQGHWVWIHDRGRVMTRGADGKPLMMYGTHADITQRKQAELALRESEERFRAVVEACPAAIFVEQNGRFAFANAAAVALFGATERDELVGLEVVERIHPGGRAAFQAQLHEAMDPVAPRISTECPIVRPDKRETLANFTGVPFVHAGGPALLFFGRDVTDARRATERLRLHEAVLRETGEIAKVGGWSLDPITGEGFWTDEVARIHGLDPKDATSMEIGLRFYSGESRTQIEAALKAAVDHGTSYDLELELGTARGDRKWVRTIGHPVVENGRVVRVRGSFQDVTELHRSQQALRESDERFRQIAENINEVFWINEGGSAEGPATYVSPAYAQVFGRSVQDLLSGGHRWYDSVHPEDRTRVIDAATSRMRSGDYDETFRIIRPGGEIRWIHDRAFPVRDASGHICRFVGTAEDITEQRRLEEQLRQAQKMQAIGTLAGGIAHDFNNLLGAIMGFAELTRLQLQDRPQERENIEDILRAGRRAIGLVRQILAFSRRSASERIVMRLRPVIEEAVHLLRASIPTTIEIWFQMRGDVPAVMADPTQIHQVLMNLGTNAWHAIGGRPGRIEIVLDACEWDAEAVRLDPRLRAGQFARVSITDSGAGMAPDVIDRIFEPFFTTKAPGEGTGLGLAVVHGIVREHEGFIIVESTPGLGSVFRVHVPVAIAESSGGSGDSASIARGRGERVLLVDDEAPLVRLGTSMLVELGYEAAGVDGFEQALERLRADPRAFDLVITDQTMPKGTGLQLAREVRSLNPDLRVIVVTGHAADLSAEVVAEAGACDLLLKPLSFATLAHAARKALQTSAHPI